jgi:hypothetical protein
MRKLLIMAMVLAIPALASAGTVWSDDFDSYATGSGLDGQGGWSGWDGGALAAIASDDTAVSDPNSGKAFQYDDMVHEYSGITSGSGTYIAWQYIPSTHQGEGTTEDPFETYFILMNKYTLASKGWSIQIGFNLMDGSIHDDQSPGVETLTILWDQWVEIKVDFDLEANTFTTYYGGNVLGTGGVWYDPLNPDHEKALAAVDLWADDGGNPVYYDNMSLSYTPIPEPSVFLLAGVGLLALLRRKK